DADPKKGEQWKRSQRDIGSLPGINRRGEWSILRLVGARPAAPTRVHAGFRSVVPAARFSGRLEGTFGRTDGPRLAGVSWLLRGPARCSGIRCMAWRTIGDYTFSM